MKLGDTVDAVRTNDCQCAMRKRRSPLLDQQARQPARRRGMGGGDLVRPLVDVVDDLHVAGMRLHEPDRPRLGASEAVCGWCTHTGPGDRQARSQASPARRRRST